MCSGGAAHTQIFSTKSRVNSHRSLVNQGPKCLERLSLTGAEHQCRSNLPAGGPCDMWHGAGTSRYIRWQKMVFCGMTSRSPSRHHPIDLSEGSAVGGGGRFRLGRVLSVQRGSVGVSGACIHASLITGRPACHDREALAKRANVGLQGTYGNGC